MSLASETAAQVAVELCLSRFYHYQYSSLSKTVANLSKDTENWHLLLKTIQSMQLRYLFPFLEERVRLVVDCTPLLKRHSNCLGGRRYVAVPNNKLLDNKPIDVGYLLSSVQLNFADKWCVALSQERVNVDENSLDSAIKQILSLLENKELKDKDLIKIAADCAYGTPRFLSPLYDQETLVNEVRLRAGMKLWTTETRTNTGGANGIYGDCYYLILETRDKEFKKKGISYITHQTSMYDLVATETQIIEGQTSKGRKLTITLTRWNNLLRRAKKEHSMKEKPIDLVGVVVRDAETDNLVFERPMFIAISGKQKSEISTLEAYEDYRHRYDIEPNFRFQKQQLLLQNYQTPNVQTLDNWLLIVQLTLTLLFLASDEAEHTCHKWQKYNDKPKLDSARLSACQTRKAAQNLFCTFDKTPFLPLKSKKGLGRKQGTILLPRTIQKVSKKTKKTPSVPPT